MPVTAQEVQPRVVEEPGAHPAVTGVVACLDHLLDMAGELAGADCHDGGRGPVARPQLLEEVAVGRAVGGREAVGRPRLTGVDGGREVVGAEVDHHQLGVPGARVLPDVAGHVQQGTVVEGPVGDVRRASVVVAHHAEARIAVDLVVGVQFPG
ncbi:hypothetical protein AB4Z54_11650, partial [Streptomyces sp. MCAF7]